jgi:hypothetical protein
LLVQVNDFAIERRLRGHTVRSYAWFEGAPEAMVSRVLPRINMPVVRDTTLTIGGYLSM